MPANPAKQKVAEYPELLIIARRWFDKAWGNTYHSVTMMQGGQQVGYEPLRYGYDEHYKVTAGELALRLKLPNLEDVWKSLPPDNHKDYSGALHDAAYKVACWQYMQAHNITHTATDVARKRDL